MPKPTDLYVARERKSVAEHDAVYGAARVTRHPDWPKRWRVWKDRGEWVVSSPEYAERGFRTHAEAVACADRMARTREVVLPRPNSAWFERPVWELGDGVTVYQSIGDQSQTITADYPRIAIPNSKRREFALALLALAEQENA